MQSIQDRDAVAFNGFAAIAIGVLLSVILTLSPVIILIPILIAIAITGFTVVSPNEAKVLTLFGKYVGTIKRNGFIWTMPLTSKVSTPLKLSNFITDHLKVNDLHGNPIEIGAVIVWRVADAAQATLNVDNYKSFVSNHSDSAIRTIAAHYPYDADAATSLRGNIDEIGDMLREGLQSKLAVAGIVIEEARLTHLAYAPEVAAAMLKRQQAVAVFQARRYMVENALAIIDDVLRHFAERGDVVISEDKKVELINSLLVTMTSDKESSPVLNIGR